MWNAKRVTPGKELGGGGSPDHTLYHILFVRALDNYKSHTTVPRGRVSFDEITKFESCFSVLIPFFYLMI